MTDNNTVVSDDLRGFVNEDLARIRNTVAMIKEDLEADVDSFEGKPFTGKTVGEMHGNLSAAISACAGMIDKLAVIVKDLT